jgi:predicted PurR-regulated permease PerM
LTACARAAGIKVTLTRQSDTATIDLFIAAPCEVPKEIRERALYGRHSTTHWPEVPQLCPASQCDDRFVVDAEGGKIAKPCNPEYNVPRLSDCQPVAAVPIEGSRPMKAEFRSSAPIGAPGPAVRSRSWAPSLLALGTAAALVFVWYYAPSLLLLFAGILFAAFLDACTRGLAHVVPLSRSSRFGIVVFVFLSVVGFAIGWGLVRLSGQAHLLLQVMNSQLDALERHLADFGVDLFGPEGRRDLSHFIADPGRLFGHVQYAVNGAYVVAMNAIVIVCLGVFLAVDPGSYRDGVLRLVAIGLRPRAREVMDEMGRMLRYWLLGQLVRSVLVAVTLWLVLQILGVPAASLLALQAGVANFVPYLGPLIAALPVALVAAPLGLGPLAWVMAIYFCIQTLEGFVVAPLIQKGAVNVPPAWTLFAIVLLGAMFGVLGVALAAPLLGVVRVALLRFYVEGWLDDRPADEERALQR